MEYNMQECRRCIHILKTKIYYELLYIVVNTKKMKKKLFSLLLGKESAISSMDPILWSKRMTSLVPSTTLMIPYFLNDTFGVIGCKQVLTSNFEIKSVSYAPKKYGGWLE